MKQLHKILGYLVAAMVQVILASWFYEWLGRMTSGMGSIWRRLGRTERRHWAEYIVPAAHVLAVATLVVGAFKVHWVQGAAAVLTVALIHGYMWWPAIRRYAVLAYSRVMRAMGRKVGVKVETPSGPAVEVEFKLIGQEV